MDNTLSSLHGFSITPAILRRDVFNVLRNVYFAWSIKSSRNDFSSLQTSASGWCPPLAPPAGPGADKARDRTTGEIVALKRVRFDRCRDGMPVTSIRELRVLQECGHPNIVGLKKVVTGSQADRSVNI